MTANVVAVVVYFLAIVVLDQGFDLRSNVLKAILRLIEISSAHNSPPFFAIYTIFLSINFEVQSLSSRQFFSLPLEALESQATFREFEVNFVLRRA